MTKGSWTRQKEGRQQGGAQGGSRLDRGSKLEQPKQCIAARTRIRCTPAIHSQEQSDHQTCWNTGHQGAWCESCLQLVHPSASDLCGGC